jgi:hypothetical protein
MVLNSGSELSCVLGYVQPDVSKLDFQILWLRNRPFFAPAQSLCPLQYPRAKSKGAPGLAFETWDPSNQFLLKTPTLLLSLGAKPDSYFTALVISLKRTTCR